MVQATGGMDLEEIGARVAKSLRGKRYGTTKVIGAQTFVDFDDEDEVATYLDLVLSDPSDETWPYDEILALRHDVLKVAKEAGLETPLYVRLAPSTGEHFAEDDEPVACA